MSKAFTYSVYAKNWVKLWRYRSPIQLLNKDINNSIQTESYINIIIYPFSFKSSASSSAHRIPNSTLLCIVSCKRCCSLCCGGVFPIRVLFIVIPFELMWRGGREATGAGGKTYERTSSSSSHIFNYVAYPGYECVSCFLHFSIFRIKINPFHI